MNSHASSASRRWLHRLDLIALAGLVASVLFGVLVPLYEDEVVWRLQERAGFDGRDAMFSDRCGPNTIIVPPWFMWPARWFSAWVNGAFPDPLAVRIEGIACALLLIGLLWRLSGKLGPAGARLAQVRAVGLALLGLGVLPLLLVLSRPEQPVVLATVSILLLALAGSGDRSRLRAWLRCLAIVALAAVAQSYHLKGVLYAVVALAGLAVCARGRETLLPRATGAALLIALTAVAARYWSVRFACPGDALLAQALAGQNLAAALDAGAGPGEILRRIAGNLVPLDYLRHAAPTVYPMSEWLPPGVFPTVVAVVFGFVLLIAWPLALVAAGAGFVSHLRARGLAGLRHPALILAGAILACVIVWSASQATKNAYESMHVLPMLAIVAMIGLSLRGDAPRGRSRLLAPALVALALAGQVVVAGFLAGPLGATAARPGYIDRQPFSYSAFGYARTRADAARAMRAAGFPVDRRLRHVLIDDGTYFALQDSYMPLHRVGVLEIWNGSIRDPAAYLRARGSDGIVMGCRFLPDRLRRVAVRAGQICAVSAAGLREDLGILTEP